MYSKRTTCEFMEKKIINERNSIFLKKLVKLRTNLAIRQQYFKTGQKKIFFIKLLPLLVIFFFLWLVFNNKRNNSFVKVKKDSNILAETDYEASPKLHSIKKLKLKVSPEASENEKSKDKKSDYNQLASELEKNINYNKNKPLISLSADPTVKSAENDDQEIYIPKCLACKDVKQRKFIKEQYIFSVAEDNTPVIWMVAKSKNVPQIIKHIYYFKGKKYCEVPLSIKYPRTRTWSYVTLDRDSPRHTGSWRVDIVKKDGKILKQIKFKVVP